MDRKAIVLMSGGIDSAVLLAYAVRAFGAENVAPITFMYGQQAIYETAHVNAICERYGVRKTMFVNLYGAFKHDCCLINSGDIPDDKLEFGAIWELPLRNAVFATLAASNAGVLFDKDCQFDILIGLIKPEDGDFEASDTSPEFVSSMNALLDVTTYGHCRVVAPFVQMPKDKVILEGIELEVPFELTYSCYQSGQVPCGKCGGCLDRARAFAKLELHDPYYTLV